MPKTLKRAPARRLIQLWDAGGSLDEIAELNRLLTETSDSPGSRPNSRTVRRWLREWKVGPRTVQHTDLLPKNIKPKHKSDLEYKLLAAEDRIRQGKERPGDQEKSRELRDLLYHASFAFVITYSREEGFGYKRATREDTDIVRYSTPGSSGEPLSA